MEFFHLVGEHLQVFSLPGIGWSAHFITQVGKELRLVRQLLPHLGQEGGAAGAVTQDDAVDARL